MVMMIMNYTKNNNTQNSNNNENGNSNNYRQITWHYFTSTTPTAAPLRPTTRPGILQPPRSAQQVLRPAGPECSMIAVVRARAVPLWPRLDPVGVLLPLLPPLLRCPLPLHLPPFFVVPRLLS